MQSWIPFYLLGKVFNKALDKLGISKVLGKLGPLGSMAIMFAMPYLGSWWAGLGSAAPAQSFIGQAAQTLHKMASTVGDIVLTLPALTDGDKIGFLVTEPYYIRVNVNGVEVFNYGGTDGAAGGYVRSNTPGTQWDITAVAKWYLGQIAGYIKYDE